VTLNN